MCLLYDHANAERKDDLVLRALIFDDLCHHYGQLSPFSDTAWGFHAIILRNVDRTSLDASYTQLVSFDMSQQIKVLYTQ